MSNKSYLNARVIICMLVVVSFLLELAPQTAYCYNRRWDQGHDNVIVDTSGIDAGYEPGSEDNNPCSPGNVCNVYAASGSLQEINFDFEITGIGPPLTVIRSYNGNDASSGLFGHRWSLSFGRQLVGAYDPVTDRSFVVIKLPTGHRLTFYEQPDGSFEVEQGPGASFTLAMNPDSSFTATEYDGTVSHYTADGQLTAVIDRNGNQLDIQYNGQTGAPEQATDAAGRTISILFGPNGKIASITDYAGRTTDYGYSAPGDLTSVTDPLGNTTTYTYDVDHRLTSIIDARGNTIQSLTYDSDGKVSSFVENGMTYTMTYFEGSTIKTDSLGNSWTSYYDDYGLVYKVVDPFGYVTRRQFNYIVGGSTDSETFGATEGINLSRTSGATASASSSYPYGNYYTPDKGVDGSLSTVWVSHYNVTDHYFQVSFADAVDIDRIVLAADYDWGLNFNYLVSANLEFSNGHIQSVSLPAGYMYDDFEIQLPSVQTGITWVKLNVSLSSPWYVWIPEFQVWSAPSGGVTYHYTYDSRGNRTSITDPLGNVTTFAYDPVYNQVETMTDPLGVVSQYEYDANGNLLREYKAYGTPEQVLTSYTYDGFGNTLTKTDPEGNTWTYTYDQYGNLLSETDPLGNITTYSYDQLGNLVTITDPLENMTQYEYDLLGRITGLIDPLGNITTRTYDANGNMTTSTDANGNTASYEYDTFNRAVQITDPLGNITTRTWHSAPDRPALLASETDALGHVTFYEYDAIGNSIKVIRKIGDTSPTPNWDDVVTEYQYDPLGNLVAEINPKGDTTFLTYDGNGNLLSLTDPLGNITAYTYNANDLLTSLTDANGNTITFEYDMLNSLTTETDALGYVTSYTYDASGRRTSRQDPNGNMISFEYDGNGRMVRTSYPDGETPGDTITYECDLAGNLIRVEDSDSRILYSYDAAGRQIEVETGDSPNPDIVQAPVTVNYAYDANGNLIQRLDSEGGSVSYTRDALNRVVEINASSGTTAYAYDPVGQVDSIVRSNGAVSGYTCDELGRLLDLTHVLGSDSIAVFHYQYDKNGNRVSMSDLDGLHTYAYDALNQLVGATHPQSFNPIEAYSYDPVGNRVSSHLSAVYTHDAGNRLLENDDLEYGWDNAGRLIWRRLKATGETSHFAYSPLDELTYVSSDTCEVFYAYAGDGKRIQKTVVYNGTDSSWAKYSYHAADLLFEHDQADLLQVQFLYAPGVDNILESSDLSGDYLHFSDALGSVAKVTDASGSEVKSQDYDSYGNIVSEAGLSPADYIAYTGREYESEIGLYYFRARFYDPFVGRFISRDPIRFGEGWFNLYSYVLNNPLKFADPSGMLTKKAQDYVDYYENKALFDPSGLSAFQLARNDKYLDESNPSLRDAEHYLFAKEEVYSSWSPEANLLVFDLLLVPGYTSLKGWRELFSLIPGLEWLKNASEPGWDEIMAGWEGAWTGFCKRRFKQ